MAEKIRFDLRDLEAYAEGILDIRGCKGDADVPVHFTSVRLHVKIKTDESNEHVQLAEKYCPVQSLIRAAVPDFEVTWERM